jgi:protein TonB
MPRASRFSGSLPVSIAVHLVAIVILVVVPLTDLGLPMPIEVAAPYIQAMAVPPPPLVRLAPAVTAVPPAKYRDGAPIDAPDHIAPEAPRSAPMVPDLPVGDASGAIADAGGVGVGAPATSVLTPPAIQKPAGPIRVSELVQAPRKLVDARPVYPDIARQARVEGTVVLEAILDRTGRVDQLRVVRSIPLLDQPAIDAVRQWRYTPSTLNGQPVAVLMTITIRFTLQP